MSIRDAPSRRDGRSARELLLRVDALTRVLLTTTGIIVGLRVNVATGTVLLAAASVLFAVRVWALQTAPPAEKLRRKRRNSAQLDRLQLETAPDVTVLLQVLVFIIAMTVGLALCASGVIFGLVGATDVSFAQLAIGNSSLLLSKYTERALFDREPGENAS